MEQFFNKKLIIISGAKIIIKNNVELIDCKESKIVGIKNIFMFDAGVLHGSFDF